MIELFRPRHNQQQGKQPANNSAIYSAYVHPCIIGNTPHIVYPRGLAKNAPEFFNQLKHHFETRGYQLREDQRDKEQKHYNNQRRKWAPLLFFTAGMLFENAAFADTHVDIVDEVQAEQVVELQLMSNRQVLDQIPTEINLKHQTAPDSELENAADSSLNDNMINNMDDDLDTIANSDFIYDLLKMHYQVLPQDPEHIARDFRDIANYYSEFNEVVALFRALENKPWSLVFDENNWMTIATGSAFNVNEATIHFNTRTAAQLRLNASCKDNPVCIASPADALLHELLHANNILNETEQFLASGGMNKVMYPYQHENHIIKSERTLYAAMSKTDSLKRPHRRSHAGRIVRASCPTCIK